MFDKLTPILNIGLKQGIPTVAADHKIDSLQQLLQVALDVDFLVRLIELISLSQRILNFTN